MDKKHELMDYTEMAHDARRALVREREELMERAEQLDAHLRVLDAIDAVLKENSQLKEENGDLQQQLNDEKQQRAELEMKLMEMSKLSVGVAKKSSQEEVLKALRTYVNISKRKTLSKRVAVKMMIMELANAIGLAFPEDMIATLESLDDEQTEPKVAVQVDYVENKFHAPVGQVVERVDKLENKAT